MKSIILFWVFAALLSGCDMEPDIEKLKKEVLSTEKNFEKMAADKGIASAFHFFADSNAVIKRENDTLIIGKENIRTYYKSKDLSKASVKWTPDFISISKSGDIAYTYGKYIWKIIKTSGDTSIYKGVFHTVWKRQKDNSWKYVWD